eukprot:4771704-Alexandrium_andersonii.AAC.1
MGAGDGVAFVSVSPEQMPREVRSAVARLRVNLGHPPKQDLLRWAAAQGAKPAVLTALSALSYAACLRAEKPSQARPAAPPRVGQFCHESVGDIFFAMGLDSRTCLDHVRLAGQGGAAPPGGQGGVALPRSAAGSARGAVAAPLRAPQAHHIGPGRRLPRRVRGPMPTSGRTGAMRAAGRPLAVGHR